VRLNWCVTLEIASISEGGLELKTKPPTSKDGKFHECTYNIEDHLDWPGMKSNMPEYAAYVVARLDTLFTLIIPDLNRDLLHQLNNQNKLYMPGSGVFFFKNGTFNNKGDFLTEIKWDGTNFDREAALKKYKEDVKAAEAWQTPDWMEKLGPMKSLQLDFNMEDIKKLPSWFGKY
jgi:hypothetical protein